MARNINRDVTEKHRATRDAIAKMLKAGWFSKVGLPFSSLVPPGTVEAVVNATVAYEGGDDGAGLGGVGKSLASVFDNASVGLGEEFLCRLLVLVVAVKQVAWHCVFHSFTNWFYFCLYAAKSKRKRKVWFSFC
ncbi:hypothetical protein M0R45_010763 [Rubus argutus]|uniref:Uncharacterized protein n=1 Tax=Rubus argutus TaxID=59490 RepID=A0AAW1YBB0_RUBAR